MMEWISVRDQLPVCNEHGYYGDVFVFGDCLDCSSDHVFYQQGKFLQSQQCFHDHDEYEWVDITDQVKYWMPYPDDPEEE